MKKFHFYLKKLNDFSKSIFIGIIRWYRRWISSSPNGILILLGLKKGPTCVFFPTCSEYAIEAIQKYGIFYGTFLAIRRILRCHPWQKNRFDPVK